MKTSMSKCRCAKCNHMKSGCEYRPIDIDGVKHTMGVCPQCYKKHGFRLKVTNKDLLKQMKRIGWI